MQIEFTQYLRPNGRRTITRLPASVEACSMARALQKEGVRLECEVLSTGVVSFTAELPGLGDDDDITLAHELVDNGPNVPSAVHDLIYEAYAAMLFPSQEH